MRYRFSLALLVTLGLNSPSSAQQPTLAERQAAYDLLVKTYGTSQVMLDEGFCLEPVKTLRDELAAIAKRLDLTQAQLRNFAKDETDEMIIVRKFVTSARRGDPKGKELATMLCAGVISRNSVTNDHPVTYPAAFRPFSEKWQAAAAFKAEKVAREVEQERARLPPIYAKAFADLEKGTMTIPKMRELGALDMLIATCSTPEQRVASRGTAFFMLFRTTKDMPLYDKLYSAYVDGEKSFTAKLYAPSKLDEDAHDRANDAMCSAAAKKYPDFQFAGYLSDSLAGVVRQFGVVGRIMSVYENEIDKKPTCAVDRFNRSAVETLYTLAETHEAKMVGDGKPNGNLTLNTTARKDALMKAFGAAKKIKHDVAFCNKLYADAYSWSLSAK